MEEDKTMPEDYLWAFFMSHHSIYMQRALELAQKARGRTSPNPMVGAVIVREGKIIGEGYHERAGMPHAEVVAIQQAQNHTAGADLYVTLEPCCHWGRMPPCTEAIIEAGIARVFMAMQDPDPRVSGKGKEQLIAQGIEVVEGIAEAEARRINEFYCKYIQTGQPFVILKAAMSLDGKIATASGESQWITSPASRERVHRLRDEVDAILVGIGTVLADDPALTTRIPGGHDALRIIVDSRARLPLSARVCRLDSHVPTLLATTELASPSKLKQLESSGVQVLLLPESMGHVDIRALMRTLGHREITSVLVEGGSTIHAAILTSRVVDKIMLFVAPKLVGGDSAPGPIGGVGIQNLSDAIEVADLQIEPVGKDWLFTGYVS